jgi:hypothetical protein
MPLAVIEGAATDPGEIRLLDPRAVVARADGSARAVEEARRMRWRRAGSRCRGEIRRPSQREELP